MVSKVSGRGNFLPRNDMLLKEIDPLLPRGEGHLYLGTVEVLIRADPRYWNTSIKVRQIAAHMPVNMR